MDPWTQFRAQMPVAEKWAYFDHAAVGPLPATAAQAISRFAHDASADGDFHWPQWSASASKLRSHGARLLGAEVEEIALVANTTLGIQTVALAFPWKSGDSIVLPSNEFPSNQLPWMALENRGVKIRLVSPESDGSIDLVKLREAIDSTTRLVSLSWVGYATGHRVDLHEVCDMAHRKGAQVFVDAIQGLGVFPLDTKQIPIDYAAADGHKWMLGPEGAGLLYIRRSNLECLQNVLSGWNSLEASHEFVCDGKSLKSSAARYEGGSANHVGLIGLEASLGMLLEFGCHDSQSGFANCVLQLAAQAREGLLSVGAQLAWKTPLDSLSLKGHASGIISFHLPGKDPQLVRRDLMRAGVILSVRHGALRIALHAYNDANDIERMVQAIRELG
ncbi:MAG: aminotransferase class V-fold PLP-dependent enzyme [Planctomycetaceae bacterium]|nr:aminotransferase class V-fold PLP-dependent enzyme [Planctomycetaceae bacterium]